MFLKKLFSRRWFRSLGGKLAFWYMFLFLTLSLILSTRLNFRKDILMTLPLFFLLSLIGGLLLAFERLSRAYEKLSQFSSDAAHELRTPLASLMGEIEAVLANERSHEEYRAVLMSNLEEISRLSSLVNNLLFLSKSDDPSQEKKIETVDLNAIIGDVAEIFEPVAHEKQLDFSQDIIPTPLYIQGEKWQIEQVISNLLDNAIRYNRYGGSVVIGLKRSGDFAKITVKDTGMGIADGSKEKVFDRFYREDSSRTRNIGGFGLGLSIVKSIIEAHAGRISVSSQLGEGSTFIIELPLLQKSLPFSSIPFYPNAVSIKKN